LSAILLAVELLLFEWKPRSLIPVALASATAGAARRYLIGLGPLFPTPPHPVFIGPAGLMGCVICGILAGALSALLTSGVYAAEDAFAKLPIHWMWWPAIGGLVIGLGGMVFPQALGVGYETIGSLLQGNGALGLLLGILLVKSTIWAVSLGSGTSGGVLAPLLMMGGALGGLEASFLPAAGAGFWPLVSMGAILGGTMRSPLTGIVFAIELTHDVNMILPLIVAAVIAHGFTVLVLKRSILTEKVARRGFHLSREYSVDPLEALFVREVMRTRLIAFEGSGTIEEARGILKNGHPSRGQHLYPVIDADRRLTGVITRKDLTASESDRARLSDVARRSPEVAVADESLRAAIYHMAETGYTRMPVVNSNQERRVVGMVSLEDMLHARSRSLTEERTRERVLRIRLPFRGARESEPAAK
jgi:CBS domain-containing protein